MGTRADLGGGFVEVPLHGLGVAAGQGKSGADTAPGQMAPKMQAELVR